jgi:hypothetical protein
MCGVDLDWIGNLYRWDDLRIFESVLLAMLGIVDSRIIRSRGDIGGRKVEIFDSVYIYALRQLCSLYIFIKIDAMNKKFLSFYCRLAPLHGGNPHHYLTECCPSY